MFYLLLLSCFTLSSQRGGSDAITRPGNLTLTLQANPFQCDSRLCWLKEAEHQGWINFYYYYSYVSPECANLPGISWEEIRMDCNWTFTKTKLSVYFFIINFIFILSEYVIAEICTIYVTKSVDHVQRWYQVHNKDLLIFRPHRR